MVSELKVSDVVCLNKERLSQCRHDYTEGFYGSSVWHRMLNLFLETGSISRNLKHNQNKSDNLIRRLTQALFTGTPIIKITVIRRVSNSDVRE